MASTKREWTKAKFERYMKEGRGQGHGKNYQPWIKIQNFPSEAGLFHYRYRHLMV